MFRKLLEFKSRREQQLKAAEAAIENGQFDVYEKEMGEVESLNTEIARIQKLCDEKNRFAGGTGENPSMSVREETPEELSRAQKLAKLIGTESYKNLFFKALRDGISPKHPVDGYEDLYKAMTLSGGDPIGADGGFLVPPDFQTRVIELAREMVDLSAHVHVETVTSPVGWRIVELSAARSRMNAVGEGTKVPLGDTPKFKRIDFSCKTYADRIAISGDLMDNADGLMEYLARWFAKKFVATKNGLVLDILNAKELSALGGETDAEKVKAIKRVLNKGIPTAASKKAKLLTNQNGYDALDNLCDEFGRPYLKPDVSGDFDRFKNRPVIYGDNDIIEDIDDSAPLYIGDLEAAITLFIRDGMRMDITNVGGAAWENLGYEIRVACSMDCKEVDEAAVVKCGIAVDA